MEAFLMEQLNGDSGSDVIDLCLDHELVRGSQREKFIRMAGLEQFPDLEVLSVAMQALRSTAGLPFLPYLHRLNLSHNVIETLEWPELLPPLTRLDLSHNLLADLQGFPSFPLLQELNLGHNHLNGIADLPNLPSLETLVLSGNRRIKHLEGLHQVPGLQTLYLKQCFIADWGGLRGVRELQVLGISPGDGSALEVLSELPLLRALYISAGRLQGRIQLPAMPALLELEVKGGLQVEAIAGLEGLPQIESLVLRKNQLHALHLPAELNALRHLDLSYNPLMEVSGLEALQGLEELVLEASPLPPNAILELEEKLPHVHVVY